MEVGGELGKWDLRFLGLAKSVADWSKDPSSQIGAIAVGKNRRILSTGYNGFPRGVNDTPERYEDRNFKYPLVVHAELNCVCNAGLNGVSLKDAILYVHGIPVCHECAKAVVQSGISRVIMLHKPMEKKWVESFQWTKIIFNEAGIVWSRYEDPSIGRRNEPSRQTDTGPETERNVQTLRTMDDAAWCNPVQLHKHRPSPWSREDRERRLGTRFTGM